MFIIWKRQTNFSDRHHGIRYRTPETRKKDMILR